MNAPRRAPSTVKAVLFDLGGVVLDIAWEQVFEAWARHSRLSAVEIAARFQMDSAYQEHERGALSGPQYFDYLKGLVEYQGDDATFVAGWNAIFVGPIASTVAVLNDLGQRLPLSLLTNTNATHEQAWRAAYAPIIERFEQVFVSSTMGCRKPDRSAFEYVLTGMNIDAGAVLFFDDSLENVHGALAAGLQAVHVIRPEDIRRALIERRILPADAVKSVQR